MPTNRDAAGQLLLDSAVNPRTGQACSLADNEVKTAAADAKKRVLKNSAAALKFLKSGGCLDAKGKLARKYGG